MSSLINVTRSLAVVAAVFFIGEGGPIARAGEPADGTVVKRVLDLRLAGTNLLNPNTWRACESGAVTNDHVIVFDDSGERRTATITLDGSLPDASRDLVSGKAVKWVNGATAITLDGECVAVVRLRFAPNDSSVLR